METFVAVVRAGSFRGAADAMRIPRSTVSQRVARLEAQLGARLLERTTRSVRVTAVGTGYHERCARIVAEVEEANLAVANVNTAPRGVLRIGCTLLFGHVHLASMAAAFVQKYPDVSIEIVATDRRLNLVEEGLDVAVVVAGTEESASFVVRKIQALELQAFASPDYLARRGVPREPEELRDHACVVFGDSRQVTWLFESQRPTTPARSVRIDGRLAMNSLMMVANAAVNGAGVALLPSFMCADHLRAGRLVSVLEGWVSGRGELRVVYPSTRHLAPRVRVFVDELLQSYATAARALLELLPQPPDGSRKSRKPVGYRERSPR